MITKETSDFSGLNFRTGETILIDKPQNLTSFRIVEKIRKAVGVKAGHAGTLDPLATGLLIVCTGRSTKKTSLINELEKTYTGTIILGKSSPSYDLETEVNSVKPVDKISEEDIIQAKESFTGEILQTPPMYSALKVDGKTLYRLARSGKSIYREPRKVTVYSFIIKRIEIPEFDFEITCSKGTYIRSIANDLGEKLGCGGLLKNLRRLRIGDYLVENAFSIDEFLDKVQASKIDNEAAVEENKTE